MNPAEKRSVIAGLYGNSLEWFDFLLYASFAPLFAKLFFPSQASFWSLMATYAVFAIGFFMRPLGGILLGHYADRAGRRKALIVSVTVMTCSTTAIALIPGYEAIGSLAPILFIGLRMLQGLSVGGELPSSITFLVEHMNKNRRGFAGSLVQSTAFLGILLGAFTAALLSHFFSTTGLLHWGWRLAYLMGGTLGMFGIYLRLTSVESKAFLDSEKSVEAPAKLIFTDYRRALLRSIIFTSLLAIGNYLLIAYATTMLVKFQGFALKEVLNINFIALLLLTLFIPIMGLMTDFYGRKPILYLGAIAMGVLIFPVHYLLLSGNWWYALAGECLLALILAPINASVPTLIAEMYPTAVRASGISIGYNIGQALFGGTFPMIALSLSHYSGNHFASAWYILSGAILVLTTLVCTSTKAQLKCGN